MAVASIGILIATIIYSDRSPKKDIPTFTTQIRPVTQGKSIYSPDEVTDLKWAIANESLTLKKNDGVWRKKSGLNLNGDVDKWGTQRRIVILSNLFLQEGVKVTEPVGKIEISTSKEKISGVYDHQNFQWVTGPEKDKGIHIGQNKDIGDLFAEGLLGFRSHEIELCQENKVKKITFFNNAEWVLEKSSKTSWVVIEKDRRDSARNEIIIPLIKKICKITVDAFATTPEPEPPVKILEITSTSGKTEIKKFANTFIATGSPIFKSHGLSEVVSLTHAVDLRDPTLEEAKIAVDINQSQQDRLEAIRKLRTNKSNDSIAALKSIIFENTDIDLYRYEAVDALQSIGTKEAFKVIVERLPQVGRTGFELRMARALAGALGTFFKSDEKTPEDIRRPEVDALVERAKKHPPGK